MLYGLNYAFRHNPVSRSHLSCRPFICDLPKLQITGNRKLKLLQLLRHTSKPAASAQNLSALQNPHPRQKQILSRMRAKTRMLMLVADVAQQHTNISSKKTFLSVVVWGLWF
jgi:hypothetical protein